MTTMTQDVSNRTFTREEQMTALTQIIHDNVFVAQRTLARIVWNIANGRLVYARLDYDGFIDDVFARNALMLVRVPLATVYNRIRRITGKIK